MRMLTHALPQLPPQSLYSKDTYFRAVGNDFSQRSRFLTAVRPLPTTAAFFLTKMVYVSSPVKVKVLYVPWALGITPPRHIPSSRVGVRVRFGCGIFSSSFGDKRVRSAGAAKELRVPRALVSLNPIGPARLLLRLRKKNVLNYKLIKI